MTGYEWVPGGGVMQCDEFSTAMPILRSHCAQGSSGLRGRRVQDRYADIEEPSCPGQLGLLRAAAHGLDHADYSPHAQAASRMAEDPKGRLRRHRSNASTAFRYCLHQGHGGKICLKASLAQTSAGLPSHDTCSWINCRYVAISCASSNRVPGHPLER
jgi:hypothetical protein